MQIKERQFFAQAVTHIGNQPVYSIACVGMSCQEKNETGTRCSLDKARLAMRQVLRRQSLQAITSVCERHLGDDHEWLTDCFTVAAVMPVTVGLSGSCIARLRGSRSGFCPVRELKARK